MFVLGLAAWLVSLPLLAATSVTTQVYDIDYGKGDQETLVLLNSGQVAKVPSTKSDILGRLTQKDSHGQTYTFTLDENRYIVGMNEANEQVMTPIEPTEPSYQKATYIPTTVESMAVLKKYFTQARYNPKDSQCFNRAMVWTYEWWRNHSLKSNKVLIFFTRTYIRRYNFEWWFHIAPYVHVMDQGKVVERVLDVKYSSGPRTFKQWTDIFMNKDPECPIIQKFYEYGLSSSLLYTGCPRTQRIFE